MAVVTTVRVPRNPLRALLSAETWLATVHLLANLPFGVFAFGTVLAGLAASAVLMPAFLVGIPALMVTLGWARLLARSERGRYRLTLGVDIPAPSRLGLGLARQPWTRKLRGRLANRTSWRNVAHHLLLLPVGGITFPLAAALWAGPLALLLMPVYNGGLANGGASFGWNTRVRTSAQEYAVAAVGLLLLLAVPYVLLGLAALDAALARTLLGPSPSDLTARVGELERSRARVVDAAEAERRRIERDLHDGAQQRLVSLAMNLGRARAKYAEDPAAARALLDSAHADAKQALVELRDLARGLHPQVLADRGLDAALSGLAGRSPVPVTVEVDVGVRASRTVEAIAYFVVAEALTNVAKHSGATRASVVVRRLGDTLRVVVTDDGVGGADPDGGTGLAGLADRVSGVDGRLAVASPTGGPTVLTVELPCAW